MQGDERAALLADLFPEETIGLIRFIEGMCHSLSEDREHSRSLAQKNYIPYDRWSKAMARSRKLIERHAPLQQYRVLLQKLMAGGDLEYFNMLCMEIKVATQASQSADEETFYHALRMLFI